MFEFTFLHLFLIASEILVFLVLLHMLYQRRTPESLTVWLLVIFLLPFIGGAKVIQLFADTVGL